MKHKILFIIILLILLLGNDNVKKYVIPHDGLWLRKNPAMDSETLELIPYSAELIITDKGAEQDNIFGITGNWYLTEWNGKEGWVFGGYLSDSIPVFEILSEFGGYPDSLENWLREFVSISKPLLNQSGGEAVIIEVLRKLSEESKNNLLKSIINYTHPESANFSVEDTHILDDFDNNDILRWFVLSGADPDSGCYVHFNPMYGEYYSVLRTAVENENFDLINLLVSRGVSADVFVLSETLELKCYDLFLRFLEAGADINEPLTASWGDSDFTGSSSVTLINNAVLYSDIEKVRFLLENGADPNMFSKYIENSISEYELIDGSIINSESGYYYYKIKINSACISIFNNDTAVQELLNEYSADYPYWEFVRESEPAAGILENDFDRFVNTVNNRDFPPEFIYRKDCLFNDNGKYYIKIQEMNLLSLAVNNNLTEFIEWFNNNSITAEYFKELIIPLDQYKGNQDADGQYALDTNYWYTEPDYIRKLNFSK